MDIQRLAAATPSRGQVRVQMDVGLIDVDQQEPAVVGLDQQAAQVLHKLLTLGARSQGQQLAGLLPGKPQAEQEATQGLAGAAAAKPLLDKILQASQGPADPAGGAQVPVQDKDPNKGPPEDGSNAQSQSDNPGQRRRQGPGPPQGPEQQALPERARRHRSGRRGFAGRKQRGPRRWGNSRGDRGAGRDGSGAASTGLPVPGSQLGRRSGGGVGAAAGLGSPPDFPQEASGGRASRLLDGLVQLGR